MRPIIQTLGGEVTEGAAFDLPTASFNIAVHMAVQEESSPLGEFGMQESHDNGATWKTAQQHPDVGAAPIPRLIQADETAAEAFSLTARFIWLEVSLGGQLHQYDQVHDQQGVIPRKRV